MSLNKHESLNMNLIIGHLISEYDPDLVLTGSLTVTYCYQNKGHIFQKVITISVKLYPH